MNVTHEELSAWLVDQGYAEPRAGFGHVTGDDLATALLGRFDMHARS